MHVDQILESAFVVVRRLGPDLVTKVIVHFPVCFAVFAVGPLPWVPPCFSPANFFRR